MTDIMGYIHGKTDDLTSAKIHRMLPDALEGDRLPSIDPATKAVWTKALRSGNYKQGSGKLFEDGKYCCLGLACYLAGNLDDIVEMSTDWGRNGEVGVAIPGLNQGTASILACMNDSGDFTFDDIADFVEQFL